MVYLNHDTTLIYSLMSITELGFNFPTTPFICLGLVLEPNMGSTFACGGLERRSSCHRFPWVLSKKESPQLVSVLLVSMEKYQPRGVYFENSHMSSGFLAASQGFHQPKSPGLLGVATLRTLVSAGGGFRVFARGMTVLWCFSILFNHPKSQLCFIGLCRLCRKKSRFP